MARKLKNGEVRLGWSKCLVKPTVLEREQGIIPDKFNKQEAIAMAKLRSLRDDYALTIEAALDTRQETAPRIPGDIRKHLRKMANRARRYFFALPAVVAEEVITSPSGYVPPGISADYCSD